jgi:hypothetical protein
LNNPFRGKEEHQGWAVVSPLRLDRHEVTVPFRVLQGSKVAKTLGSSLPARPWHPQNARPTRYSVHCQCSRTRLLEQSSPGVRTSYTVLLMSSPETSRSRAPLLGFLAPSALKEERVHARWLPNDPHPVAREWLTGWPVRPPVARRLLAVPIVPATVPLTGFPNLPAACSSLRRPAMFQTDGALGVHTLQGFVPSAKPRRLVAAGIPS